MFIAMSTLDKRTKQNIGSFKKQPWCFVHELELLYSLHTGNFHKLSESMNCESPLTNHHKHIISTRHRSSHTAPLRHFSVARLSISPARWCIRTLQFHCAMWKWMLCPADGSMPMAKNNGEWTDTSAVLVRKLGYQWYQGLKLRSESE